MGAQKKDVERGELPFSPHGFTIANPVPKGERQHSFAQQAQHAKQKVSKCGARRKCGQRLANREAFVGLCETLH